MSAFVQKKAMSELVVTFQLRLLGRAGLNSIFEYGEITARDTLYEGNTHNFTVSFRADDGEIFYEDVSLSITESFRRNR